MGLNKHFTQHSSLYWSHTNNIVKVRLWWEPRHRCGWMLAKQMDCFSGGCAHKWERACNVLLPKVVTQTSLARDQVRYQAGGMMRCLVSSPFPPNFVHLSRGHGFNSRDWKFFHTIILAKRAQSQVLHQKLSYNPSFRWFCLVSNNFFFLFLFLLNLMTSCATTYLAFSVHLSYTIHMKPGIG